MSKTTSAAFEFSHIKFTYRHIPLTSIFGTCILDFMRRVLFSILIFLLLTQALLHSATTTEYTSTYVSAPSLQFGYGAPAPLNAYSSADTGIYPDDFSSLLGTLTITTTGNTLFDPSIICLNFDPETISIEGYVKDNTTNSVVYTEIPIKVMAVTVRDNAVIASTIILSGSTSLVKSTGNVLPSGGTITSYICIVALENFTFIPGTTYTVPEDEPLGAFGVTTDGTGNETYEVPISVNDAEPTDTAPIVVPDVGDTTPDIPYEGESDPLVPAYDVSIFQDYTSFDISSALNGNKAKVADVDILVTNGISGTEYGVYVAFSQPTSDPTFYLHLDGDSALHAIPYRLYLAGVEMTKNQFIEWRDIYIPSQSTFTTVSKEISVSVDSGTEVDTALAGDYKDTVLVVIMPLDTI